MATGFEFSTETLPTCEVCVITNQKRGVFTKSKPTSTIIKEKLEVVSADICGPYACETPTCNRYSLVFADNATRKRWIFLMYTKNQALQKFKEFEARVTLECGIRIKTLRTDNGTEFKWKNFRQFLPGPRNPTRIDGC
jgi:transposase InsO family protein